MTNNICLSADSYKYSMFNMYPDGTEYVYSYIESRGGEWDATVFFGLQIFLKEYLSKPITQEDIDEAETIILAHGEPFNRSGWEYILNKYNGYLPLSIDAVPEGSVVPVSNVLVTIVNTDPKCAWLTTFIETALLRAVWYPTTVATNSYESKKIIKHFLEMSGNPDDIAFKLNDFGQRGVSSWESAAVGGLAHLTIFGGTDNVAALVGADRWYGATEIAGYSIPATEHSISTSYNANEREYVLKMIDNYGTGGKLFAIVGDTFDIYAFCEMLGTDEEIRNKIITNGKSCGFMVVRPDSGVPEDVVLECVQILDKHFGSVVNDKGYKVLNYVRVIQGDGINHKSMMNIYDRLLYKGYSADNVALGQGGALLQQVNRDTLKFAMKASAVCINGEWRDIGKDPITDSGKRSKKGLVTLYKSGDQYVSGIVGNTPKNWSDTSASWKPALQPVYLSGRLYNETTLDQVRARVKL